MLPDDMDGVLNRGTRTVHKRENGADELRTVCGATGEIDPDRFPDIPVERAKTVHDASKCGRCFDDGGGY